jgi:hypothetical protein
MSRAEQGALREALFYALECIGDNLDISGTEWADRPMKEWYAEWKAALAAQPTNTDCELTNGPCPYRIEKQPSAANTVPGAVCNGPFGDEESCPIHGEEIRIGRGKQKPKDPASAALPAEQFKAIGRAINAKDYLTALDLAHSGAHMAERAALPCKCYGSADGLVTTDCPLHNSTSAALDFDKWWEAFRLEPLTEWTKSTKEIARKAWLAAPGTREKEANAALLPYDIAYECLKELAFLDVPGEPNTLLALVKKAARQLQAGTREKELRELADEINQCLQIIVTQAGLIKDSTVVSSTNKPRAIAIEKAVERAKKATWAALAGGAKPGADE